MPAERFFIDTPFETGGQIVLQDKEAHHLKTVMRAKEGEVIEVVNGRFQLARAQILSLGKREALCRIEHIQTDDPPKRRIILCQALPRLNRLDTIVEKGTELGMHALWLFPGEKSERKMLSSHQVERLRAVAVAAMKQCGRLDLPEITLKEPLSKWETLPCLSFFGEFEAPSLSFQEETSAFFVGPEGGFSDREKERLQALGAKAARLHRNILRTDTAGLVALVILSGE